MLSSREEVAVNQRQQTEPSVSKTYKVTWVPSLQVFLKALDPAEKVPMFKVEVTDREKPLEKKWFVSVYPDKKSLQRMKNKLIFKGYCWDSAYHPVEWGWVILEPTEGEKGEIHF